MSDVCEQTTLITRTAFTHESCSPALTKPSLKIILSSTIDALRQRLATRHGDEQSLWAVNNFHVTYNKLGVEIDAAKCLQEALIRYQLNFNVGEFHSELSGYGTDRLFYSVLR